MRASRLPWLSALYACVLLLPVHVHAVVGELRRVELREQVRDLFRHGYIGYMTHAYPADGLRPLTCAPFTRDSDDRNIGVNDIHANASITLVDSLSALRRVLPEEWPAAIARVATDISFDQDVKVQVFEMTIRALGALLSTYQSLERLPDDPAEQARVLGLKQSRGKGNQPVDLKQYAPRMLELAQDLGERLLPAFKSPTGLPYARVNLRHGVERNEGIETCTAGAGSLVLEFALLSRLTGDERYETVAKLAFMRLWNSRTAQDLVGNGIAVSHGQWLGPGLSGVNAGIDSFFEYALKAGIMLDDSSYMDVFHDAYSAIQTHVRTDDGFIYRPVKLWGLQPSSPSYIDSLSSFFPGVMALAGDLESAIRGHLVFWNLWRKYSGIPEGWDHEAREIGWNGWPGRPEFIESTYYLHRATGDDFYLRVGERVLKDIMRRSVTKCGLATVVDLETGELEDRMESFMLSETLKYLYLLFDPTPAPHMSNTVFTTEGHELYMPQNLTTAPTPTWRVNHRGEDLFCPAYVPQTMGGIPVGIEGRNDYDYARALVFGPGEDGLNIEKDRALWGEGKCVVPEAPKFSFQLVLTPAEADPEAELPPHDPSPGPGKVQQNSNGDWIITDIDGLYLGIRWRLDGFGYDVTSIGPHRVRQGQLITITDARMDGYLPSTPLLNNGGRPSDVGLYFTRPGATEALVTTIASTALFGKPLGPAATYGPSTPDAKWTYSSSLLVVRPKSKTNHDACSPIPAGGITPKAKGDPFAILADRGGCSFLTKALHAARAGAAGLIIADKDRDSRPEETARVRPGAVGEDPALVAEVERARLAVVFVDEPAGVLLRNLVAHHRILVSAGSVDNETAQAVLGERREGRLVVGKYDLVNIRVVDP